MTRYIQLEISIPDHLQEFLIGMLDEMEFNGFEQADNRLTGYVPENRFSDVDREFIETWLLSQRQDCFIISESIIDETNWNETWEQSIRAQAIGIFFVKPTWSTEQAPEGSILLEIDPKMAFGTGYHETTRLVLRELPRYISPGFSVLDVGTGTGILAIAALKLGAERAVGIDTDEWSYNNALENSFLNGVSEQLTIRKLSPEDLPSEEAFDIVLANIDRNTLLDLAPELVKRTREILIISGITDKDERTILENPPFATLNLLDRKQENEWVALAFRKNG